MSAAPRRWHGTHFLSDPAFWVAAGAGPVAALAIAPWARTDIGSNALALLSFTVFQPLVEEAVFRGRLQPWLARRLRSSRRTGPVSSANLITSALFAAAHLLAHAPAWAAAVLLPSLVFGHFRERHGHIGPAAVLHMHYNGCYLMAAVF